MSVELDVDAITAVDSFQDDFKKEEAQTSHFSQRIYSPPYYPADFKKNAIVIDQQSSEVKRTDALAKDELEFVPVRQDNSNDREAGWSAELRGGYSWGGNEGPKYEGSIGAEGHDSHGNYFEGSVTQRSDGSGKAEVNAGHASDKD